MTGSASQIGPDLLALFDTTWVVNLPERRDRRRQTERELRRHFPAASVEERVRFYPAIRPADAGPFNALGSHGAFLSTLDILERAEAEGLARVLVLQDDVRFTRAWTTHGRWFLEQLETETWDVVQLGYLDPRGTTHRHLDRGPVLVDHHEAVIGAHCVGFDGGAIPLVLDHLRTVLTGEVGDDLRGPMPIDGAFNTLTWCHPEVRRLLPVPNLVGQRSSRSDIRPRAHDRIDALRPLLGAGRAAAGRLRDLRR